MKKFTTVFFVTLGVIFSIIILFVVYLFIFDPFHIKPLLFGKSSPHTSQNTKTDTGTTTTTGGKPFLSDGQRKTLASFGIDPNSLPSSITPAQEECFKSKLGEARYAEIVAGASPTAIEFFSAKSCI